VAALITQMADSLCTQGRSYVETKLASGPH
jgi:hypothetical protein